MLVFHWVSKRCQLIMIYICVSHMKSVLQISFLTMIFFAPILQASIELPFCSWLQEHKICIVNRNTFKSWRLILFWYYYYKLLLTNIFVTFYQLAVCPQMLYFSTHFIFVVFQWKNIKTEKWSHLIFTCHIFKFSQFFTKLMFL